MPNEKYIIYDCGRYGDLNIKWPSRLEVYGTLQQAKDLADHMSNWYSGCDYMFLVEGHEDDD